MRNENKLPIKDYRACESYISSINLLSIAYEDTSYFPLEGRWRCKSLARNVRIIAAIRDVVMKLEDSPSHFESQNVQYIENLVFGAFLAIRQEAFDWAFDRFGDDAAQEIHARLGKIW